jgi:malate dehydrogenase (oxaloacetate-decarboxylating)
LGIRQPRLRNAAYFELVDKFVAAVKAVWPKAIVQWEDFTRDVAFNVLARYRNALPCFNDDIQGTGAMALAGLLSAVARKGEALAEQTVLIVGAGAGGLGVAKVIRAGMLAAGMSETETRAHLFVADENGLLLDDGALEDYKQPFAQALDYYHDWTMAGETPTLLEIVRQVRPSVLIGLSGAPGIFNREVVETLAQLHERPVIFPFSNPNNHCEAKPEDIIQWTAGRAFVATGSPFPDVYYQDRRYEIRQGNNAFIFPGLGLAAVLGECGRISDGMVLAAAYSLAEYVRDYCTDGYIFPPIRDLKKISAYVAERVLAAAIADGSSVRVDLADQDLAALVAAQMWRAEYLPCRYVG